MTLHCRRHFRNRILLLLFALLLILCVCFRNRRASKTELPVLKPLDGVLTERAVGTVTVTLTGVESEAAIRLFSSVCCGMELTPQIFVSTKWLEKNEDLMEELSFAEFGLLLDSSIANLSRKKLFSRLAEENERFCALTGQFPRYIRLSDGEPGSTLSAALQAYGQQCVGNRVTLNDGMSPGGIVDCGLLNGTTGYLLAKYCAAAMAQGYTFLPLSRLQQLV